MVKIKTGTCSKVLVSLIAFFVSNFVIAQDITIANFHGEKAIQICVNDVLYGNFNITATSFYKKNRAYEVMVGYKISIKANQLFFTFDDPTWYYNQFTLRGGLRYYTSNGLYFAPMITAAYGFYKDLEFSDYGGMKNYYPLISREKESFGSIAKFGLTSLKKRYIIDFYFGLGYRFSYIKEKIFDPDFNTTTRSDYWKKEPTVHFGFQIGFLLK